MLDAPSFSVNYRGSRLLVQYSDGYLGLYEISTGTELIKLTPSTGNRMFRVKHAKAAFSNDYKQIVTARYVHEYDSEDQYRKTSFELLNFSPVTP